MTSDQLNHLDSEIILTGHSQIHLSSRLLKQQIPRQFLLGTRIFIALLAYHYIIRKTLQS